MDIIEIIEKKKRGLELNVDEIIYAVDEFTNGNIPDYQMSALLMAICLKGMSDRETSDLTFAMMESGETIDLSEIPGKKVDKHSSGGIGDKATLIVGPLVASLGVNVVKMSGRGLGVTGGTVDKLESIPGFCSDMSVDDIIEQLKDVGFVDAAQSPDLAPADKKIYALRDVTGTVDSIPLIASSIMSKKLASGADALVLDVKCGSGAFMNDIDHARKLAETMINIGNSRDVKTIAVISDMNEPLGKMVGNSLELVETVRYLKPGGWKYSDKGLDQVVITLASWMVILSGWFDGKDMMLSDMYAISVNMLRGALDSGAALDKFREFIKAQHGDDSFVDDIDNFVKADNVVDVYLDSSGFIASCSADKIGMASCILGAGRMKLDDSIDPNAGVEVMYNVGDYYEEGAPIARLYTANKDKISEAESLLKEAYTLSDSEVPIPAKIIDILK